MPPCSQGLRDWGCTVRSLWKSLLAKREVIRNIAKYENKFDGLEIAALVKNMPVSTSIIQRIDVIPKNPNDYSREYDALKNGKKDTVNILTVGTKRAEFCNRINTFKGAIEKLENNKWVFIGGNFKSGLYALATVLGQANQCSPIGQLMSPPRRDASILQSIMPSLPSPYLGEENPMGKLMSYSDKIHITEYIESTQHELYELYKSWCPFGDTTKSMFVEKSVENLMRSRYLQKVFKNSKLIYVIRHPIIISLAIQQALNTSAELFDVLLDDAISVYELLFEDLEAIQNRKNVFLIPFTKMFSGAYIKSLATDLGIGSYSTGTPIMPYTGSDNTYLISFISRFNSVKQKELKEKFEIRLRKLGFSLDVNLIDKPVCDNLIIESSNSVWCRSVRF